MIGYSSGISHSGSYPIIQNPIIELSNHLIIETSTYPVIWPVNRKISVSVFFKLSSAFNN